MAFLCNYAAWTWGACRQSEGDVAMKKQRRCVAANAAVAHNELYFDQNGDAALDIGML